MCCRNRKAQKWFSRVHWPGSFEVEERQRTRTYVCVQHGASVRVRLGMGLSVLCASVRQGRVPSCVLMAASSEGRLVGRAKASAWMGICASSLPLELIS